MDRTDHTRADWLLLVATKLSVDGVDTGDETPLSVAARYYANYPNLSPRDAVRKYMAQPSGPTGSRTIVPKEVWIDRFLDELLGADPDPESVFQAVTDFAESTYQLAWDLVPEDVANSYAAARGR